MDWFMGDKYQFCVIVEKGRNNGLRNYVWASETELLSSMKKVYSESHSWVGGVTCFSNLNGILKFRDQNIGSLEIIAKNEPHAIMMAKKFGLPRPFVEKKVGGKERYLTNTN